MKYISDTGEKLESLCKKFSKKSTSSVAALFHYLLYHANPFYVQLCYLLVVTLVGFLALMMSKPRTTYKPGNLDLFFTAASATTVSSMATVEMEVFSNDQLIIMTILMTLGGEVFVSGLSLLLQRFQMVSPQNGRNSCSFVVDSTYINESTTTSLELGVINLPPNAVDIENSLATKSTKNDEKALRYNSIKSLGYVVLGYLLVLHVLGSSLVSLYISATPSANNVLKSKGLSLQTFSTFTIVSTFTNCGFLPTNENMVAFKKKSGLLLILTPLILLGNTLFPPSLRVVIWGFERFTKRKEYTYILTNYGELGYGHLTSSRESWFLASTVIMFIIVQFVIFCIMEWSSGVMDDMSLFEKLVGSLFQTTNTRHTGESIVDLSAVSSAILVLFVVMMYLPPYTSFLPTGEQQRETSEDDERKQKYTKGSIIENFLFSQITYLAIFVIVICITERRSLKEDPVNFNVLNIVTEIVSAYGNVGFSTGYSCKRRLKTDGNCKDAWYGFVGRWSKGGKLGLLFVMFFGRLKKFHLNGGKAWKLS